MHDADVEHRGGRIARSFGADSRGLSTPVTHALTIAITGLLMVMLVSTASGFLTDQQEFAARDELDTIGNQLADDVQAVVALGNDSGAASVYVSQPDSIVGHQYTVVYEDGSTCDTETHTADSCLVLSVAGMDVSQTVPVSVPDDVSFGLDRANPSTFELSAESSSTGGGNDAAVPMSRTMRVGVGQSVDSNAYGEVIDPTNRPPIPKFTFYPDFPESGDPVTFDAAPSRDPDGSIIDYQWYVDGLSTGTGDTQSEPLLPGKHNITLRVEDDEGAEAVRTRRIRVSGLSYNDDFVADSGGTSRCNGVEAEFSMTNAWGDTISVTHLGLDPGDKVNQIENNRGAEVAFDMDNDGSYGAGDRFYEFGRIDVKDKPDGVVLRLRDDGSPVDINSGQTVGVSVCKFQGGGNLKGRDAKDTTFGFRYWNDGATNRTVVEPNDGSISDYTVEASGEDIVVSFDSERQIGSLDAELGNGSFSTSLSLADFTQSNAGGTYQYEATLTEPTSGSYTVELTAAEDVSGTPADSLPLSDSATILGGGDYAWESASDWDAHQSSVGVVHQNYGDYADDTIALGRPPESVDSSLVSYWHFDGGSVDDGVGSNDGIIHGSPSVTEGVAGTSALRFDGDDDYVEVPHDSSLEMSDDDQVTVSMWVNKHRKGSDLRALFQKSDTSFNMQFENGDNFDFTVYDNWWYSTPQEDLDTSSNRYYHLVGTFDGATIRSFVDGSLVGTNGAPYEIEDSGNHPIGIGANLDSSTGASPDRHARASIDDVRIYDSALRSSQIETLSNVTKGSIVTDRRSGPTISKHSDIEVSYDGDIDSGESITFTVYAEPDSGSTVSESITIDDTDSDSGTVSLSGINKDASEFYVRAELNSPSSKRSPELHGVSLEEGS